MGVGTYGEEFSLNVGTNRRRCFVITVTFDSGRSKVDVYCLYTGNPIIAALPVYHCAYVK